MHRSSTGKPNADSRYLARPPAGIDPYAGMAIEASTPIEAQIGQGVDEQLLDLTDVGHRVCHTTAPTRNGEHRIADQLARAVISDVAATINPLLARADLLGIHQKMIEIGIGSAGEDVVVLEQQ